MDESNRVLKTKILGENSAADALKTKPATNSGKVLDESIKVLNKVAEANSEIHKPINKRKSSLTEFKKNSVLDEETDPEMFQNQEFTKPAKKRRSILDIANKLSEKNVLKEALKSKEEIAKPVKEKRSNLVESIEITDTVVESKEVTKPAKKRRSSLAESSKNLDEIYNTNIEEPKEVIVKPIKKRRSSLAKSIKAPNTKILPEDTNILQSKNELMTKTAIKKRSSLAESIEIPDNKTKNTETVEDIVTDSSQSGDEKRTRRQLNNNLMFEHSATSGASRVLFPVEVKACAIQRIRDGETHVQVARDLECPISTVASWWQRRAHIVPELASEVNSDSAVSSVSKIS